MTRYTKLEGRRALPSANRVASDDEQDEPAPPAPTPAPAPPSHEEPSDPKKLLKRAKLLRLKAKKTNSDETRAKHMREAKALEQQATALNGARGALGKRKAREEADGRPRRPRLGTYPC